MGVALAAEPTALQSEFDVEVYSQQGATMGCGLTFNTAWVNYEHQVLATVGSLTVFAGSGSILKIGTSLNNQVQNLSFAWVVVPNIGSTKTFSPLLPNQTGPSFSFAGKPDSQGLVRLSAAARTGFTLGISIVGLPLDETVNIPAAPLNVLARLDECTRALTTRQTEFESK
ncbi:MAG TPA: hypothetical protein VFQ94_02995 [Gallionella sp.]|nr:hypothetical protein [Gallionella sp.]